MKSETSRRDFLKNAGALIVGFSMAARNGKLAAQSSVSPIGLVDATQVDSWISIGADDSITVYSGKIEFGQDFVGGPHVDRAHRDQRLRHQRQAADMARIPAAGRGRAAQFGLG